MNQKFTIAVHGGAGTILRSLMTAEKESAYRKALEESLMAAHAILSKGGYALDAAVAAVQVLEDCPLFNAGRGSVFTHDGTHEMDASVMDGKKMNAGAVAGIQNVRNPVLLANAILQHSDHVFMVAKGAEEFARKKNLEFEKDDYFFDQFRYDQLLAVRDQESTILDHSDKKFGTVGAVVMDRNGNLAAATSTGGMTNKRFGRVGDTPLIGAGTYANNTTCAVSCTGHGEYFIRRVVAYDISCLMEYKGFTLQQACEEVVIRKLKEDGGEGGVIAVDAKGNHSLVFNSEGMYRGSIGVDGRVETAIFR